MEQGRCTNFGHCAIADARQLITLPAGSEAYCPDCKRPLALIAADTTSKSGLMMALLLLGLLFLGIVAGAFYFIKSKTPANSSEPTEATSTPTESRRNEARPRIAITGELLRLHGSNTIGAELAPALAVAFLKQQGVSAPVKIPGAKADEWIVRGTLPGNTEPLTFKIEAHGSSTAFADLAGGKCDIGMSSRRVKPEEVTQLSSLGDLTGPGSEHILALDGVAVIVNQSNPVQVLSKDQLKSIFSGKTTSWQQAGGTEGAINVMALDSHSGTFDTFSALVLSGEPLVANASRFEDNRRLAMAVSSNPNAIGFVGLPYAVGVKTVAVAEKGSRPLLPTQLTVATEDYPLSRRLYLYTAATPSIPLVDQFLRFAISKAGQEIVSQTAFVTQNLHSEIVNVAAGASSNYRRLTGGAERLSLDFRFRPGSSELDNKARPDLDRTTSFANDPRYVGKQIVLLGFADNTGNPQTNTRLSKDRANAVAEQLRMRGLDPALVTGLGPEMPVASNETEEGRSRNRRVEIWMRR